VQDAAFDRSGTRCLHLRYLTSNRDPWYRVEKVEPPDIIVGAMSKGSLRAVTNVIGAIPSNSMYGIYLKEPWLREPLTEWLNSKSGQTLMRGKARHYGSGLLKIEPRDLLTLPIPVSDALLGVQV
jgi:adenine-specific DNA-methyltransferase